MIILLNDSGVACYRV